MMRTIDFLSVLQNNVNILQHNPKSFFIIFPPGIANFFLGFPKLSVTFEEAVSDMRRFI